MPKSVFTPEYDAFLRLLRQARRESGVSQVEMARLLGTSQSVVSKSERGERRLDVIELRSWCAALGVPLTRFVADLDRALRAPGRRASGR